MTDNEPIDKPGGRVLSREEARRKRKQFLAQAADQEKRHREKARGEELNEPTVATMILPGD